MNLGGFSANTNNASLFIYIFNTKSASFDSVYTSSYNSSNLVFTIASVQNQLSVTSRTTFATYDFSAANFSVDTVGSVYFGGYLYFAVYDNSSSNHLFSNIDQFESASRLYLETFSANNDYSYSNKTISNSSITFTDIHNIKFASILFYWEMGGSTQLLIENVDFLTQANSSSFYIDSNTPSYKNLNFSFIARDIENLNIKSYIYIAPADTCKLDFLFEDIGNLTIQDQFYYNSSLSNINASSVYNLTIRNITWAKLYELDFVQTNAGTITAHLDDITTLITYVYTALVSSAYIDFKSNFSAIDTFQFNGMYIRNKANGNASYNFQDIGVVLANLFDVQDLVTRNYFSLSFVDIDRFELQGSNIILNTEKSAILFDQIRNLTVKTIMYCFADTPLSNKSFGQNSYIISNVQYFKSVNLTIDLANGQSTASIFNIGQLVVTQRYELAGYYLGNNATYNFYNISSVLPMVDLTIASYYNGSSTYNFGPDIPQLNVSGFTINNMLGGAFVLKVNVFKIPSVNVNYLGGNLQRGANISFYDVNNTLVNNVPASITAPNVLWFNFFGTSTKFNVTNNPGGTGTTVRSFKDSACSCSAIETL